MNNASAAEALLFAALEKSNDAERAAFLDSACGGDTELRGRVEKLLKAHADAGDFLQKPAVEQMAVAQESSDSTQALDPSTDQKEGTMTRTLGEAASDDDNSDLGFLQPSNRPDSLGRLGHYEVLQVLGKGGFGIVFRAFDETLQRVVALKVMAPLLRTVFRARSTAASSGDFSGCPASSGLWKFEHKAPTATKRQAADVAPSNSGRFIARPFKKGCGEGTASLFRANYSRQEQNRLAYPIYGIINRVKKM
jgi:hypothetical protein